jgi:hypothetical protein
MIHCFKTIVRSVVWFTLLTLTRHFRWQQRNYHADTLRRRAVTVIRPRRERRLSVIDWKASRAPCSGFHSIPRFANHQQKKEPRLRKLHLPAVTVGRIARSPRRTLTPRTSIDSGNFANRVQQPRNSSHYRKKKKKENDNTHVHVHVYI